MHEQLTITVIGVPFPSSFTHAVFTCIPYANLYDLSLPMPFKSPVYTAIGPFPLSPRPRGRRGGPGWSAPALAFSIALSRRKRWSVQRRCKTDEVTVRKLTAAGLSLAIVMAIWTTAFYLAFLIAAEASNVQQLRSSVDRLNALKQLVTAEQVRFCHT